MISGLLQKRPSSRECVQEGAYPIGYVLAQVLSLLSDPEQVYPDTQIGLSEDKGGLQWERIKITEVKLHALYAQIYM